MQFTPASNVSEAASRSLFWAVNGLNKALEMHFDFPFNLIGKLTIVLQQANRGVYSNLCKHLGPRTRFFALARRQTRGLPVIPVVVQAMSLCKLE